MHSVVDEDVAVMCAGPLAASYTLVFRGQSDEWVAIGSITSAEVVAARPIWLIVGVGKSPSDAKARLWSALEREAVRVGARRARLDVA